jgi:hypothetical protein
MGSGGLFFPVLRRRFWHYTVVMVNSIKGSALASAGAVEQQRMPLKPRVDSSPRNPYLSVTIVRALSGVLPGRMIFSERFGMGRIFLDKRSGESREQLAALKGPMTPS